MTDADDGIEEHDGTRPGGELVAAGAALPDRRASGTVPALFAGSDGAVMTSRRSRKPDFAGLGIALTPTTTKPHAQANRGG